VRLPAQELHTLGTHAQRETRTGEGDPVDPSHGQARRGVLEPDAFDALATLALPGVGSEPKPGVQRPPADALHREHRLGETGAPYR